MASREIHKDFLMMLVFVSSDLNDADGTEKLCVLYSLLLNIVHWWVFWLHIIYPSQWSSLHNINFSILPLLCVQEHSHFIEYVC